MLLQDFRTRHISFGFGHVSHCFRHHGWGSSACITGEFQHCRRFVNWVSTNIPPLFDIPLYRSNGTSLDRAYFCLHPISFLPRFLNSKLAGLVIQFFCIHLIVIYFCSPGGISLSWFSYTFLGSEPCLSSSFSPSYFNPTLYLAEEENGQTTTQEPP